MSTYEVVAYFDRHTYYRPVHRFSERMRLQKALDWMGGHRSYPGHSGTDFRLIPGTPILAMAGGLVTNVYSDLRGGLSIFIDHGGGVGTSYRHCSTVIRSIGQSVDRGDVIAFSGTSGIMRVGKWFVPSHVHVTVWFNGLPVDPFAEETNMDEKGLWVDRNTPRPQRAGDEDFDYPFSWQWLYTAAVLKQAAVKHPFLFGNFAVYAQRMLPQYLSFNPSEDSFPRLTLPFLR